MRRCPFCESSDLIAPETLVEYPAVHCRTCGALGPKGVDPEGARAGWERRPEAFARMILGMVIGVAITIVGMVVVMATARRDADRAQDELLEQQLALEAAAFDRGWQAARRDLGADPGR